MGLPTRLLCRPVLPGVWVCRQHREPRRLEDGAYPGHAVHQVCRGDALLDCHDAESCGASLLALNFPRAEDGEYLFAGP